MPNLAQSLASKGPNASVACGGSLAGPMEIGEAADATRSGTMTSSNDADASNS
jgi:hypothetical protein